MILSDLRPETEKYLNLHALNFRCTLCTVSTMDGLAFPVPFCSYCPDHTSMQHSDNWQVDSIKWESVGATTDFCWCRCVFIWTTDTICLVPFVLWKSRILPASPSLTTLNFRYLSTFPTCYFLCLVECEYSLFDSVCDCVYSLCLYAM